MSLWYAYNHLLVSYLLVPFVEIYVSTFKELKSNAYGRNLLQEAIVSCENTIAVDLVKLLIRCGEDALSKNNAIRSPLDFAKQIKDMEMINILTDKKSKF